MIIYQLVEEERKMEHAHSVAIPDKKLFKNGLLRQEGIGRIEML
jgi:hypothetical protein